MAELDDGTAAATDNTPGPSGGVPPAQPITDDADLDLDLDGDGPEVEATGEPEASDEAPAAEKPDAKQAEPQSPWPERPADLDASNEEAIAEWKAERGLPDREEYQLPGLDEGKAYTDYGKALSEKVVELAYELDMSPAQAQQLILRGDGVLKAITEARDTEDKRAGSRALLDEFDGDREAIQAHVTQARAALKALPDGLGKVILEARGPDGRKLVYTPEFLRWAAELGARQTPKGRTSVTQDLKGELAELTALRDRDIDEYHRPYKGTGRSGSDRVLEITRQLDADASAQANHAADRDAGSDEERQLLALHRNDPQFFEFGRYKDTGVTPAKRLFDLRAARR